MALQDDNKFVVVTRTYPTSYGCNQGRIWNQAELICRTDVEASKESYDSYQDAIKAARKIRESNSYFDDGEWDDEPPWNSADLENFDNDEEVVISVKTRAEYDRDREEDRLYLEKENLRMAFEGKLKTGVLAEQAKANGGKVFYSIPSRPELDVPAELEIEETTDPKDLQGKDLGSLKSLCFCGSKEKWAESLNYWNNQSGKKEDEPPQDLLLEMLPKCTSLQELHLKKNGYGSVGLSSGYMKRVLEVAPHLADTLKVLSFPLINIDPDGVESIVDFSHLEHLDMWGSMSLEHYDFGVYDDSYEEKLPYDDSIGKCVMNLEHLTRLDLGYGDPEMKRAMHDYALSRTSLWANKEDMEDRGGTVTMEETHNPQDFADDGSREAAVERVLLGLSQNKEEKPEIREMAQERLKKRPHE